MKSRLDKAQVRAWLRGHKVASARIEKERYRSLASLTVEESASIYESLTAGTPNHANRQEPSYVLWQMRKVLDRYSRINRKRRA